MRWRRVEVVAGVVLRGFRGGSGGVAPTPPVGVPSWFVATGDRETDIVFDRVRNGLEELDMSVEADAADLVAKN